MKVLVTGATGLIGRQVCVQLAASGHAAVALARQADASVAGATVRHVPHIGARTRWDGLLDDADAIIHIAGLAHKPEGFLEEELRDVNVEGARVLASAARVAGVKRFVLLGTAKVHGEATTPHHPFSETSPIAPSEPYARSKYDAELAVASALDGGGTSLSICRTALVHGPGVKANFLALIRLVDAGVPLPFGRLENARSMVSATNLASALVTCCADPRAAGETFLVADEPAVSTPALIRGIARHLGRKARLVPVPTSLLAGAARLAGRADAAQKVMGSFVVDSRHIRRTLDWTPPQSFDEGMQQTIDWYRKSGRARAHG